MTSETTKRLKLMVFDIADNENISAENFTPIRVVENSDMEVALPFGFKPSFIQSYFHAAEFMLKWIEKNAKGEMEGGIYILKLDSIALKHSSSNFNPKYYDDDDPILDFHVIDEFCNEAGVGIYSGKHATNSLYYFSIDERPEYLGLDFMGYIEMIIASKCFLYWQKAILAIRNNESNNESEEFKTHMPRLFPGWTWEEFVAKYESVKIEEEDY